MKENMEEIKKEEFTVTETEVLQDIEVKLPTQGRIFLTINNADGTTATILVKNRVLVNGRQALAKSLANDFDNVYSFYIRRVFFGNNGTSGGAPRAIEDTREGLFGPATLVKSVIASVDQDIPGKVIFTTTVGFDELVGSTINEMALEMANGEIFSMATFPDVNKTSGMSLVYNWIIQFIG